VGTDRARLPMASHADVLGILHGISFQRCSPKAQRIPEASLRLTHKEMKGVDD
jgi:hypothetical protein